MKLTQKDLMAAMQPLRRAAERIGLDAMNGTKQHPADLALFRAGIEWHGFTIKATLIRKARVSCGVPAPYSIFQIKYAGTHPVHGQIAAGWEAASFRVVFIRNASKLTPSQE